MKRLLENLLGVVSMLALGIHTILLSVLVLSCALARLLLPENLGRKLVGPAIIFVSSIWLRGILWWLNTFQRIEWDIENEVELSMDQWNMVISNHQSWVDIFALFHVLLGKIPLLKFFIKKELAWVPIVGQAWWALDYPFMQRHSRAEIAKNPQKATDDLEATKKACKRFSYTPTSVVNFLEGTRFTPEKYSRQKAPYKNLLRPKAGGIAFAIQALGERFSSVIDTTIVYHDHRPSFWDMACGRVGKVTVHMRHIDIPKQFVDMDYMNNREDKKAFQGWLHGVWLEKDALIDEIAKKG
ncbi:acyltransferase [Reinekea marinisedimentorum]|uniref:1-acyl-sn-glycerol-3-phosphate acyltransferase n=1 Tax=Reinekea marinisedimentorum TaxID=230495 RepID=A0A4R3I318_9GAMM|nr:acyltransferase [Reinekea marinisedimentorum]TCS40179.1 1-acyl-sn-glycerol-3-phosphate acyltransferase [Reinekea marinisedimentorum]